MIVAPSLVMVTSPSADTRILSIPLGPRDVRTIWEMDFAARMFAFVASRPFTLDFACCSLRITKGLPYSSGLINILYSLSIVLNSVLHCIASHHIVRLMVDGMFV